MSDENRAPDNGGEGEGKIVGMLILFLLPAKRTALWW